MLDEVMASYGSRYRNTKITYNTDVLYCVIYKILTYKRCFQVINFKNSTHECISTDT